MKILRKLRSIGREIMGTFHWMAKQETGRPLRACGFHAGGYCESPDTLVSIHSSRVHVEMPPVRKTRPEYASSIVAEAVAAPEPRVELTQGGRVLGPPIVVHSSLRFQ